MFIHDVAESPRAPECDREHSDYEQRWVTIGQASNGQTLVVIHTFTRLDDAIIELRLISARKADREERNDYEQA